MVDENDSRSIFDLFAFYTWYVKFIRHFNQLKNGKNFVIYCLRSFLKLDKASESIGHVRLSSGGWCEANEQKQTKKKIARLKWWVDPPLAFVSRMYTSSSHKLLCHSFVFVRWKCFLFCLFLFLFAGCDRHASFCTIRVHVTTNVRFWKVMKSQKVKTHIQIIIYIYFVDFLFLSFSLACLYLEYMQSFHSH